MTRLVMMVILLISVQLPPHNTIDNPRLVLHPNKHMVQVKWYQYVQSSPKHVIVFKVTNTRRILSMCHDVDWGEFITQTENFRYCYNLYDRWVTTSGYITVTDTKWAKGDQYYIIQYEFSSHNAPYGPFIAG